MRTACASWRVRRWRTALRGSTAASPSPRLRGGSRERATVRDAGLLIFDLFGRPSRLRWDYAWESRSATPWRKQRSIERLDHSFGTAQPGALLARRGLRPTA